MRTPLLALGMALVVAGCGVPDDGSTTSSAAPAEQPVTAEPAWQPSVEVTLAEIGTVGDLPPTERTIEITVDADGALSVDGTATDLAGLRSALQERGGGRADGGPVDADVLLVLDSGLPWRVGQLVMQECAAAWFDRLFFAVRHASDREPGAIATFLPTDRGVPRYGDPPPKLVARLRPMGTFGLSYAALGTAVERCTELQGVAPLVEIDAHGDATVGHVLLVADAAARGGAAFLTFTGAPGTVAEGGLPAEVQAYHAKHRLGTALEIRGVTLTEQERLGAASPDRAVPPRVSGAYAGFTDVPADLGPEEELEEEPLPETDEPDDR